MRDMDYSALCLLSAAGRLTADITRPEIPQLVGKRQHEVLLQHLRLDILDKSLGDVALDARVLLQQVEDAELEFTALAFEKLLGDSRVPEPETLVEPFRQAAVQLVVHRSAEDEPRPEYPVDAHLRVLVDEFVVAVGIQGISHHIIISARCEGKVQLFAEVAAQH